MSQLQERARVLCRLSQPASESRSSHNLHYGCRFAKLRCRGALRLASHKHRTLVVLWLARGDDRDTAGSGLVRCAYPEEVCREAKGNGALRLRLTLTCAVGVAVRWSEQLQVNSKNYSSCWHPHTRCAATGWFSRRAGAGLHGRPRAVRE